MADGKLRFMRLPDVKERTGLGRSQIYDLEKQGRFPRRNKILSNTTVWLEEEVHAWMVQRIAHCRNQALSNMEGGA